MKKVAFFEVWKAPSGAWRWRLVAPNGEVQGQGEGYTRKQGALRGVEAFKRNAARATVLVL